MKYIFSLTTGILAIFGNLMGGYWVWSNTFAVLVVFVAFDWLLRSETDNKHVSSLIPDLVLILHVILHTVAIGTLLSQIYNHNLVGWSLLGATISTGLNSGISGIISAHELIHRKSRVLKTAGIWNLFLVHYTHFYIEHIFNHHKNVGTAKDPATARLGESLYAFYFRTIPGQFLSALKIAGERKKWYQNFVLIFLFLQIITDCFIYLILGKTVFMAFLLQAFLSIVLLEYVNYIEHYGLVRKDGTKVDATHAWQSNALTSRISLLELSRHSDHHLKASKPYHTLNSHKSSPEMPSGYFGVFYFCLIPSLWFKMMHPLINKNE